MEQNRALRVLEFTKIREMLAQNAITEEGRQRCLELVPCHDLGDVNHALAETEEAVVLLTYLGQNPLVSYPDVRESIARAQKGACLSPRMLLDVSAFLRAARAARSALVREREDTPILTGLASRLTVLERVETDINDAILSEEEIADRASTELYQIRRQIRGANERMRDKLNQMIRSSSFAKNLQDPILTMRNDRYVLPVKAEYRASVPGLVHDQSASGATLFIEPMAAVEMGNELKQWEAKEKQEIERILAALSAEVAPYAVQLKENLELLAELDFAFAKGLLSRDMSGVTPKMNRDGFINIIRGRHPLIDREKVVPIRSVDGAGLHHADHHRPQHGRQDGDAENRGLVYADGTGGSACARRSGHGAGGVSAGVRGHRRRAVHRAVPVHVLRAHDEHRGHPE